MCLLSHEGLAKLFGRSFLFDPASSLLGFYSRSRHLSLRWTLHSVPISRRPCFLCGRTFASTKYSALWGKPKKQTNTQTNKPFWIFSKNNPVLADEIQRIRHFWMRFLCVEWLLFLWISACDGNIQGHAALFRFQRHPGELCRGFHVTLEVLLSSLFGILTICCTLRSALSP